MDEDEGGMRLSKRFSDKEGEVDYKTKAGTAWSHNYLNQKPWHPLSYPNQRRKWIAEQTHAQKEHRAQEVAREYAQEQEFFRQTSLVSKKEKEKMEMMKAVSFMYVRPPGYNAESAKAAEVADERKSQEQGNPSQDPPTEGVSNAMSVGAMRGRDQPGKEQKKPRPKDVFGRALPTEEQFEILKNAPRLETGVAARAKPFAVEIRNVKCVRCGNYGHQSGDRECPLKDVIMPNEESRLKRDDPLTAILAQTESSEPVKWELKQKPGMSPPRGGFKEDDPNQQIVAEEIFDEYGGFLGGENIPGLLANFSSDKPKKKESIKSKRKRRSAQSSTKLRDHQENGSSSDDNDERRRRRRSSSSKKEKNKRDKRKHSRSSSSEISEYDRHHKRSSRLGHRSSSSSSEYSDSKARHRSKRRHHWRHRHHSDSSSE
ncbi:unnamed protein product [Ilex paraguariensis]|uniref:CBF1-interacting co-repressor CIR N-terminal domain-containing protein n=1 Tax=Ilex paraguariensis TaxID=185542 RepID=A0ABC8QXK2_9AQUA